MDIVKEKTFEKTFINFRVSAGMDPGFLRGGGSH